jgi:hypothetical protein
MTAKAVESQVEAIPPVPTAEEQAQISSEMGDLSEQPEEGVQHAVQPETTQLLQPVRDEPRQGEGQVPAEVSRTKDDEGGGQAPAQQEVVAEAPKAGQTIEFYWPEGGKATGKFIEKTASGNYKLEVEGKEFPVFVSESQLAKPEEPSEPTTAAGQTITEPKAPKPLVPKKFSRETETGGPDILSWMNENMRILSKSAAKRLWKGDPEKFSKNASQWDDSVRVPIHHNTAIYSDTGRPPNEVAQAAFDAGKISEPTPSALWAEIDQASKKRLGQSKGEKKETTALERGAEFESNVGEGTGKIPKNSNEMGIGDKLTVGGKEYTVKSVDADNGEVLLSDGTKIEADRQIYVEKYEAASPAEGEPDFGPMEETPAEAEPKAETQFENKGVGQPADKFGAIYGPKLSESQISRFEEQVGHEFDLPSKEGTSLKLKVKPNMLWMEASKPETPGSIVHDVGVAYLHISSDGTTVLDASHHGRPIDKLAADSLMDFLKTSSVGGEKSAKVSEPKKLSAPEDEGPKWTVTQEGEVYGNFKSKAQAEMVASGLTGGKVEEVDIPKAIKEGMPEPEKNQPPPRPSLDEHFDKEADQPFKAFSDAHDQWEEHVKQWADQFPENKALVFQGEHHTYAVTKDPKGGWRYTSFYNKDRMPSSHQEFATRQEAIVDLLKGNSDAKFVGHKLPFTPVPLPAMMFPHDDVTWHSPTGDVTVNFRGFLGGEDSGKAVIVTDKGQQMTVDAMELTHKKEEAPKEEAKPEIQAQPVSSIEPLRSTENGGRLAIVLPNGKAVVGGKFHGDTWVKALEKGVATDAELADGYAGFVKPDGTAWGVNGKPLPKVSEVYIVDDVSVPKETKDARQRPPEPSEPAPVKIGLSTGEKKELSSLVLKDRAARESGGEALTQEEQKRYEALTGKAGQQELLGEDVSSGVRSRIKELRAKADEMDRLRIRTQERSFESIHRREELFKEARTYATEAQKARAEADKLEASLPPDQAGAMAAEEPWPKPAEGEEPAPWQETEADHSEPAGVVESGVEGKEESSDFQQASVQAAVDTDMPVSKEVAKEAGVEIPKGKYRIGTNPQTYTMLERLEASPVEIENGEQPVRVRNEKTGREEVVLESELIPVKERTAEEREASKGMSKKELKAELLRLGMEPDDFHSMSDMRKAIKRAKAKLHREGPGAMTAPTPTSPHPFDPKAEIQALEESFRNISGKKMTLKEKMKTAWDTAVKRFGVEKDELRNALIGLKASGDMAIKTWGGYGKLDDLLKAKGELSAAIQNRGKLVQRFADSVEKAFPTLRERAAIRKYVDAGGDMAKLQHGAAETKPEYRQAYIDSQNLSPDAKVAAENLRSFFEARLQEAIDAGVLKDGVEDYIHRIYERDPKAADALTAYMQPALLKTNPTLALKRVFDMDWEAEKLGYKVVQDFLPALTHYETSLSKAIAAREFVKRANALKAKDGRPILATKGVGIPINDPNGVRKGTMIKPHSTPGKMNDPANKAAYRGDYVERPEYGALRNWKWLGKDADGKPIFLQGDVAIHPDYVNRFDALLEPSRLRFSKKPGVRSAARFALGVSSAIKQTMLDFSGFHQVQEIVHALEHKVQPGAIKIPYTGVEIPLPKIPGFTKVMREIDLTDPKVQRLLRGGVTIGGDYHSPITSEGLFGRSLSRAIPGLSEVMNDYHKWLFQDFIPRTKMTMALEALGRNEKRFKKELISKKMSLDEVDHLTANQANAAFGELNYIMLERSKTMQDLSRLIMLAPDFLEARGRFAAQAFTKHGTEQRMALLLGAATLWTFARVGNMMLNNQMHNEPENLFSIVHGNKAYGLRTVQGDILHLLEHPLQFWMSRLNPVFGRTMLEFATGRDYFGRKRSVPEQMWDFAATAMPVSLRTGRERSIWESLMNGMGVNARRWTDTDDAFKLAQKWKDKNKIGGKGEFIYDADKDPLRPLKVSLSNNDEKGATREIKKLLDSKQYTVQKLREYFNRYARMPFTGSFANDRKFEQTLTEDEKKTVQAAREHKRAMRELYFNALAKYQEAQSTTATP